jgi:hypothetical protein
MTKFDFDQFQKFVPKEEVKLNNIVNMKVLDSFKDIEILTKILRDWWQFGTDGDDLIFTSDAAMHSGQFGHVDAGVGATITTAGYGNVRIVGDSRNNLI